jgi:catechol 2,3-dioxygenase-like lactoylglutathione lyase family enzyme
MLYDRIDHVVLPLRSLDEAVERFQRLGLTLFPGVRHEGRGTRNSGFFIGEARNEFYVELLGVEDDEAARAAGLSRYVDQADAGGGVASVVLRVQDLDALARDLAQRGVTLQPEAVYATDGRKVCDVAAVGDPASSIIDLRIIQYPEDADTRFRRHADAGLVSHAFRLKRLDHLAAFAPDLEAATHYWSDVLGIPPTGQVVTPAIIIRQFGIGDAIVELLGPAGPDSPMRQRPPGLASMAAFEVDDLDGAVAAAQQAGFTPSEPGPGPLPNTRTATIPATELSGMSMQLLQYV